MRIHLRFIFIDYQSDLLVLGATIIHAYTHACKINLPESFI